jgi:hypothetical protein
VFDVSAADLIASAEPALAASPSVLSASGAATDVSEAEPEPVLWALPASDDGNDDSGTRIEVQPAAPARSNRWVALAAGAAGLFLLFAVTFSVSLAVAGLRNASGHAAASRWTVLFRADDPSVWDTYAPGEKFAVPLQDAPDTFRYLRLRRMDTGAALILPLTPDQLHNGKPPTRDKGFWWNGTAKEDWKGRHLGIVEGPRHKFPAPRDMIGVMTENWDAFAGSGFGHKCFVNDKQYYCWRGKEIPRTVFEIAVADGPLTPEEERCLLDQP